MTPVKSLSHDARPWPRVPPPEDACLKAVCHSARMALGTAAAEIAVSRSDGRQLGARDARAEVDAAPDDGQDHRCIAEMAIASEDGSYTGVLSLFDTAPRRLSQRQAEQLRLHAAVAAAHLSVMASASVVPEPPRAEASRYRALAHALPQMIWVMRASDGEAIYINRRFEDFYGPIGRSAAARLDRHHPDDQVSLEQAWDQAKQGLTIEMEVRLRRHDDCYRWHKIVMIPVRSGDAVVEWIGTALDIDEMVRAHKKIEDATGLLRLAQTAAGAGVWEWMVASDTVRLSPESARMHGLAPEPGSADQVEGPLDIDLPRWKATIHPKDFPALKVIAGNALRDGGSFTTEFRVAVPSQAREPEFRWLLTFGQLQRDAKTGRPDRLVGLSLDVTERKEAQSRIEHMALHDGLTGLPNRMLLRDRLSAALADGGRFALLLCDLDGFKAVNDTLGHAAGDTLLQAIAGRLRAASRSIDTVARLGGDEFAVLLNRVGASEAADVAARRLIETVSRPVDLDGHEARVGISIGIALAGEASVGIDDLMRAADTALYSAKASGRNTHRFAA